MTILIFGEDNDGRGWKKKLLLGVYTRRFCSLVGGKRVHTALFFFPKLHDREGRSLDDGF